MATPDDESGTLFGPPRRRPRPSGRQAPDRADRTPVPGEPPPSEPPPRLSGPPWRPEPAGDAYETIPPAARGFGGRRPPSAEPPPPAPPATPPPPSASTPEQFNTGWPPFEPLNPGWSSGEPAAAPAPPAPGPAVPAVADWEWGHASVPPPPAAPPPRPAAPPPQSQPFVTAGPASAPVHPVASYPPAEDPGNKTISISKVFPSLKTPPLTLQFFNTARRRWSDLKAVRGDVLDVGRADFLDWNPNADDLAERHLRLMIDEGELYIKPLPSLNGVYVKMKPNRPAELRPGARFRVGRHVLALHPPEPDPGEVQPLRSAEGEVFQSRLLRPLGFLALIGPDGEPYIRFPLTKLGEPGTRIGREGARCDLALTGDEWVSGEHARVFLQGDRFFLEDLKSTNGTFLQILDELKIERGIVRSDDSGDHVAIGGYLIRVIEER